MNVVIMRTLTAKDKKFMMKMFNVCIRHKTEYYHIVQSPSKQEESSKLERIQKHFPAKTKGKWNIWTIMK